LFVLTIFNEGAYLTKVNLS